MTRRLLSTRASRMTMSRGLTYEYEDVFAACDPDLVIDSREVPVSDMKRKAWRSRKAAEVLLDRRAASGGDELVFAFAQCPPDLADHFAFLADIKAAGTSAAYIEELYITDVDELQVDIGRFLEQLDHVFVGCHASAAALDEKIDTPVSYLMPAVDLDRFASGPWPPDAVDVFAMGRRNPDLHDALVRWAEADRSRFYQYDTFTRNPFIHDHRQHRAKLADFIRRTRYFVVNEARVGATDVTGGQREIGYRFFEGAASGTVMIGPQVGAPMYAEIFPWEEPVAFVDASGDDLAVRLEELDEDPERRAGIRRRNVRGTLLRHDPAHRWRQVLDTLGLEEPEGVGERIDRLAVRAETADPQADADEARS